MIIYIKKSHTTSGDYMEILVLSIQIFLVRILDVSLGTFRTLITVKGKKLYASIIGFFEILIWFLIVREALNTDIDSIWIAISYASGFAIGTYMGSILSSKFISGTLSFQVITAKSSLLTQVIRENGFAVTSIKVEGKNKEEQKYMLFIEINNKKIDILQSLIKKYDSKAFIVVNDTKFIQNGYMETTK